MAVKFAIFASILALAIGTLCFGAPADPPLRLPDAAGTDADPNSPVDEPPAATLPNNNFQLTCFKDNSPLRAVDIGDGNEQKEASADGLPDTTFIGCLDSSAEMPTIDLTQLIQDSNLVAKPQVLTKSATATNPELSRIYIILIEAGSGLGLNFDCSTNCTTSCKCCDMQDNVLLENDDGGIYIDSINRSFAYCKCAFSLVDGRAINYTFLLIVTSPPKIYILLDAPTAEVPLHSRNLNFICHLNDGFPLKDRIWWTNEEEYWMETGSGLALDTVLGKKDVHNWYCAANGFFYRETANLMVNQTNILSCEDARNEYTTRPCEDDRMTYLQCKNSDADVSHSFRWLIGRRLVDTSGSIQNMDPTETVEVLCEESWNDDEVTILNAWTLSYSMVEGCSFNVSGARLTFLCPHKPTEKTSTTVTRVSTTIHSIISSNMDTTLTKNNDIDRLNMINVHGNPTTSSSSPNPENIDGGHIEPSTVTGNISEEESAFPILAVAIISAVAIFLLFVIAIIIINAYGKRHAKFKLKTTEKQEIVPYWEFGGVVLTRNVPRASVVPGYQMRDDKNADTSSQRGLVHPDCNMDIYAVPVKVKKTEENIAEDRNN